MSAAVQSDSASALTGPFEAPLRTFGTNVPQISTVVAVVLGSLKFDKYFNAGAWTVVAVLCFGIVHIYRRQVPGRLSRASVIIAALVGLGVALVLLLVRTLPAGVSLDQWMVDHSVAGTAFMSVFTTLSLAILLTSYNKQERIHGWQFPDALNAAIDLQLTGSHFFKSNIAFVMTLLSSTDGVVTVRVEMQYEVKNRSDETRDWKAHYRMSNPSGAIKGWIDGDEIDTSTPNHRRGRNIEVPVRLAPGASAVVRYEATQLYREVDHEMLTSYTPATSLKAIIRSRLPEFRVELEPLYYHDVQPKFKKGEWELTLSEGILPYQGVRVNWERQ